MTSGNVMGVLTKITKIYTTNETSRWDKLKYIIFGILMTFIYIKNSKNHRWKIEFGLLDKKITE